MQALSTLTDRFAGEVILPSDPEYDAARRVWNGMVDRRPALVVRPMGADDVRAAIRYAREQDLLVAVRGGGHSIPGLSTCDGGIVIDLSLMGGAEVDAGSRRARVGGGALLAELDEAAQAHGLVCPVGVVSHTGVGGLTLGGGMGRLQRRFGLTIDNLRAVELVTADGRLVRASEEENPDLFWGLRGAGANFGIATAFEFGLNPMDPVITHGNVVHPIERASELAAVYSDLAASAPRELWLTFGVNLALPESNFPPELAGRPIALVAVHHCGSPEQAERDLAPLRAFGPPLIDTIEAKPYLEAQHLNDQAQAWGHRFYMKSAFVPALPDEVVTAAVDQVSRLEGGIDGTVSIWTWGGAIADVGEGSTAFTGRDAAFWVSAEVTWEEPALDETSQELGRAFVADVAPYAVAGRYVNDVAEPGEDVRAIYGDAKQDRLVALKRAWDPDNVFRLNQNIRP